MRDYAKETAQRVEFIREKLKEAHADGIIFGNSGGKDCALVGILCKMACDNTVSVIMPCESSVNFGSDKADGDLLAKQFGIETRVVDLTPHKKLFCETLEQHVSLNNQATTNIPPRLRMITLYGMAAAENRLVAGTGNRDELYMGYFTKWGDGAHDFDPISDLTVGEVYEFLRYLGAPESIITKAPSAGLFEGQTDEAEMGVSYKDIDTYLMGGEVDEKSREIIERYHRVSAHKRRLPAKFKEIEE